MFGVPDGDKIISPGGGMFRDHTFNIHGEIVDYGTLSQYRSEDEAISISTQIGSHQLEVKDNIFRLHVEADNQFDARKAAREIFDQFILHLTLQRVTLYRAKLIQLQGVGGRIYPEPQGNSTGFYFYNLRKMGRGIHQAASRADLQEQKLQKALAYYQHAHFLYHSYFSSRRNAISYRQSGDEPLYSLSLAITSAYLNIWKSITTILGDPSSDRDYQSRFRTFGFPKNYWTDEIKPLYDVRNSYDVAHYSLNPDAFEQVHQAYSKAERVCRDCILKYIEHLQQQNAA